MAMAPGFQFALAPLLVRECGLTAENVCKRALALLEKNNADSLTVLPRTPKRIGVAADHGGFELKEYLAGMSREADYKVVDFGDGQAKPDDDYPDLSCPWPVQLLAARWTAA